MVILVNRPNWFQLALLCEFGLNWFRWNWFQRARTKTVSNRFEIGLVRSVSMVIFWSVCRCDCNLQDDDGFKPIDVAKASKRSDIVSLLQLKSKWEDSDNNSTAENPNIQIEKKVLSINSNS